MTLTLDRFRRIVVKVGSSLLVDGASGSLKHDWLAALGDDLARLHASGKDVLVVSSGAIALGRGVLRLPRGALKLEESQAAAGQMTSRHAERATHTANKVITGPIKDKSQ